MKTIDFQNKIAVYIKEVDEALAGYVKSGSNGYAKGLFEALDYALFPGGKRLRPLVLLGCFEAAGGSGADALPFACALELIHSYSLIHDDLPAMDDDDIRRGKPACHIRFGEAIAILAGDGLLNMAYEIMAEACACDAAINKIHAMSEIAAASGVRGMVAGQAADMDYQNKTIDKDVITYIHRNKSAALFAAAAAAGAFLGGGDPELANKYKEAGTSLGLAFQIQDDLEDWVAEAEKGKNTYPLVIGKDRARVDFETTAAAAVNAFRTLSGDSFITSLAGFIVQRRF